MSKEERNDFSDHILIYSFLLAVLVVFVHAVNLAADGTALSEQLRTDAGSPAMLIQNLFSNTLGQAAVPGFFLLSAFLFYRTLPSLSEIPAKWRRRVRSLLIPYCSWNLLWYILYTACGRSVLSPAAACAAILHYSCNPVFWYLYQLLLLTVLAPAVFFLTRRRSLCLATLIGTLLLVYFQIDLPLVNVDALFYYLLGACWAVHGQNYFAQTGEAALLRDNVFGTKMRVGSRRNSSAAAVFFAAAVLFALLQAQALSQAAVRPLTLYTVLLRASLSQGIWFLTGMLRLPAVPQWMRESFFLYAAHYPIVRIWQHLLRYFLAQTGAGDFFSTICYFLTPVICVMITHGVSAVLRKYVPKGYGVLTGNR